MTILYWASIVISEFVIISFLLNVWEKESLKRRWGIDAYNSWRYEIGKK